MSVENKKERHVPLLAVVGMVALLAGFGLYVSVEIRMHSLEKDLASVKEMQKTTYTKLDTMAETNKELTAGVTKLATLLERMEYRKTPVKAE